LFSFKDISVDLEEKSPVAIPILGAKIGLKIRAAKSFITAIF